MGIDKSFSNEFNKIKVDLLNDYYFKVKKSKKAAKIWPFQTKIWVKRKDPKVIGNLVFSLERLCFAYWLIEQKSFEFLCHKYGYDKINAKAKFIF